MNDCTVAKEILQLAKTRWDDPDASDFICDNIEATCFRLKNQSGAFDYTGTYSAVTSLILDWVRRRINYKFSVVVFLSIADHRVWDLSPADAKRVYDFRLKLWDELFAAADAGEFTPSVSRNY